MGRGTLVPNLVMEKGSRRKEGAKGAQGSSLNPAGNQGENV